MRLVYRFRIKSNDLGLIFVDGNFANHRLRPTCSFDDSTDLRKSTPTYGSWLNLVERWFAEITNKRIRRGIFRSVKELESAIREYIDIHNEDPKPFAWTRTADQILAGIARFAQRTRVVGQSS